MNESSSTVRAWRCHAVGDYHDLAIEDLPCPVPGPAEMLIGNRAFAAGFPDMLMVQGLYQYQPALPFTPCAEFCGEVLAVGAEVTGFGPGDAVMGTVRAGAAASRLVADAVNCLPLPGPFDFVAGAAFLIAYKTAWVGLVVRGTLQAEETVLVHGAGGGVGLAAVVLAKALGARVIAMASGPDKVAAVRAAGADAVLDYHDGGFREQVKQLTGGRGADVIYDPIGGDVFDESLHCIAPFGRMLVIGFASGRIPTVSVNYALIKQYSIIGVRAGEYGRLNPEGSRAVNESLLKLANAGGVSPHVHATLAFGGLVEAFDTIASRRVIGRVVLEVD